MPNHLTRRTLLGAAGAALLRGAEKPVRVGLLGCGSRGMDLLRISLLDPALHVNAVCDISEQSATRAQETVEKARGRRPTPFTRGPEDYKRMLDRDDIDVVIVTTPQDQHAAQAIAAMRAGKHVGSETPSAYTIDDCWALVETKEKTGRRYMLLENYPFARTRMMILNMAQRGAMGEITYGESSYIHDTRYLAYNKDGSLAWRGEIARKVRGDVYPTHALGPVSLWMNVNRGDRLQTMVSMDSSTRSLQSYAREQFGASHPAAQPGFFSKRDCTITLLHTAAEKMIVLRYDSASARPAGGWEALQGTKGSYDGSPGQELLYLEGRSPRDRWEPLKNYRDEFEHPFWKQDGEEASKSGHGGGDYFVMREFYRAVAEDREPPIDVYDGATWSAVLPLSGESIRQGFKPVEIPDFTRGKWKSRRGV